MLSKIRTDERKGEGTDKGGHEAGRETGATDGLPREHADQTLRQRSAIAVKDIPDRLAGDEPVQDEPGIDRVELPGTIRPEFGGATGMQLGETNRFEHVLGVVLIEEVAECHRIVVDREGMMSDRLEGRFVDRSNNGCKAGGHLVRCTRVGPHRCAQRANRPLGNVWKFTLVRLFSLTIKAPCEGDHRASARASVSSTPLERETR